jgi:hypothetical protein
LRVLEEHGAVARVTLPPPASVAAYALTDAGEELRPHLEGLAAWGFAHVPAAPEAIARPSWVVQAMTGWARANGTEGVRGTIELQIDGEPFWVRVDDDGPQARIGLAPTDPDLRIAADRATLSAAARGRLTPAAAAREGAMTLEGDRRLAPRFFRRFRLPDA